MSQENYIKEIEKNNITLFNKCEELNNKLLLYEKHSPFLINYIDFSSERLESKDLIFVCIFEALEMFIKKTYGESLSKEISALEQCILDIDFDFQSGSISEIEYKQDKESILYEKIKAEKLNVIYFWWLNLKETRSVQFVSLKDQDDKIKEVLELRSSFWF